jgi:hypothetical protein
MHGLEFMAATSMKFGGRLTAEQFVGDLAFREQTLLMCGATFAT